VPSVFITGASTGIGHDDALRMAGRGWAVFGGVRSDDAAADLTEASGGAVTPVMCDVTSSQQVGDAATRVLSETGGGLDGLVNNAGVAVAGPLELVSVDDLRHQLETNVVGAAAITRSLIPGLRSARGRIVNVSSVSGMFSPPMLGPYSMSKFALEAMSDTLRRELASSGITVSVLQPSRIATPIWDKSLESNTVLERVTNEHRRWYGRMLDGIVAAARNPGGDPVSVTSDAIEHALTSRRPKTRYRVGTDARLIALAVRLAPDRLLDRIDPFS
jgi:NAD(P)-dependent dehydrogenase (short-subunit alcohol dehydrogenase family)